MAFWMFSWSWTTNQDNKNSLPETDGLSLSTDAKSVSQGRAFISSNARRMTSVTEAGGVIKDNFSQLMILESTGDSKLVGLEHHSRTWNYFIGPPIGTTAIYPDDVDTTSYALKLLPIDMDIVKSVLDEILSRARMTTDGTIAVYFDDTRHQTDAAVSINVLRCFYANHRGMDPALAPTKTWVCAVLRDGSFTSGTRYYPSPDMFLFFFARLLTENPESDIYVAAASTLRARLEERMNATGDALELAMRLLASHALGINLRSGDIAAHVERLLSLQEQDGGWKTGWLCQYGKTGVKLGSRFLTTALAVEALSKL